MDLDSLQQLLENLSAASGPSVNNASSARDTNVANVIFQYNVSVATAAATSRKDRYFVEIETEAEPSTSPIAEQCVSNIRQIALTQRLVLLGSGPGIPVYTVLRTVATDIQRLAATEQRDSDVRVPVILEYSPSDEQSVQEDIQMFDIKHHLLSLQSPTILLFPRSTREHLGWDMADLARVAQERSHYIVASTDIEAESFHLQVEEQRFWHALNRDEIYEPAFLERSFLDGLAEHRTRLPLLLRRAFHAEQEIVPDRTVRSVAHELRSPANIAALIQRLITLQADATASEIHTCIEEASRYDLRTAIRRWYNNLDRRSQLLVIGLSLFDGCQESQLFAALQQLMRDVWQARDTLTPILDHVDFTELRGFFQFVETGPYSIRVEGVLSQQRRLLLSVIIESHRRHLQRALPWLVDLVKQSAISGASKHELYGIDSQRAHLRSTLGEAIAETGLLALDTAQPALLTLVTTRLDAVHVVLARSLAIWEARGQGEQLVQLLTEWQRNRQHVKLVQALLPQQEDIETGNAQALLCAASLLAVTYAIRASRPGAVNNAYWDLLIQLSSPIDDRLKRYITQYTLRMLLPQHISQAQAFLRALALHDDLRPALCKRLAALYKNHAHDVKQVLRNWFDEGIAADITVTSRHVIHPREKLLAGVVLVLSAIPRDDCTGALSPKVIHQIECRVLKHVRHQSVRLMVLTTILQNTWQHHQNFKAVLAEVREDEYPEVVRLLTDGYIEQRRSLPTTEFPDVIRQIDGQEVPLWWNDAQRPKTESETLVGALLTQSRDQPLTVLAFEAMMMFTERFDMRVAQELTQAIIDIQLEQENNARQRLRASEHKFHDVPSPVEFPQHPTQQEEREREFYLTHLVPLLATSKAPQHRDLVCRILPLVLDYRQQQPDVLELRLQLWEKGRDSTLSTIAYCLRTAIELAPLEYWAVRKIGISSLISALQVLWDEQVLQDEYGSTMRQFLVLLFIGVTLTLLAMAFIWLI